MIKRIRHKGLDRFFRIGETRGINVKHAAWLRILLTALDVASVPDDMNLPGTNLHPLKGDLKGYWAVWVSSNWRVIFRFEGTDVTDVDLVDYH
jgi:proteic killer suppression protein